MPLHLRYRWRSKSTLNGHKNQTELSVLTIQNNIRHLINLMECLSPARSSGIGDQISDSTVKLRDAEWQERLQPRCRHGNLLKNKNPYQ